MGLEMYAYTTPETFDTDVDLKPNRSRELHYWWKHPNLHGWMEQLYFEKDGESPCFNGATVSLTAEDLDRLETAIHMSELPDTRGFFFGKSKDSRIDDDLLFIRKARRAIREGKTVYYDSWW